MSPTPRTPLLALLLAVPLAVAGPVVARADNELIPATEVTARYDVWGWVKEKFGSGESQPHVNEALGHSSGFTPRTQLSSIQAEDLAAIEPASGGEESAHGEDAKTEEGHGEAADAEGESPEAAEGEGHGGAKAEGDAGGEHGQPAAHGSEGKKSFSGKELTKKPELPTVTIGGQPIVTRAQVAAENVSATLPTSLAKGDMQDFLNRRFSITPYAHSPRRGDANAPIQVIQFVDLSCGQCLPELAKIDAMLKDSSATVALTSIHAPTARFQDTNMPAFYGKIADRAGLFWVYRANLIQDKPVDANAVFNELIKSGMSIMDARSLMLTDARRFYRELDADALLARSFGVSQPPVLFVNGIRVGEQGLPLDKLPDVLQYLNARIARGLPEPPKP